MENFRKSEIPYLLVGIFLSIFLLNFLYQELGLRHVLVFSIGLALGITLYHASFGFTGGWRDFIENNKSNSLRAQIVMLAFAIVLFSLSIGHKSLIYDGNIVGAIAPVSLSVIVGSFIFGFAMQLGGGCGSGTLFTAASGNIKMFITLIFFIIGSLVGTYHFSFWSSLPSLGAISLLDKFNSYENIGMQLSFLVLLYIFFSYLESKRNTQINHLDIFKASNFNLIKGPWPLFLGAILLAILNFFMLHAAGHPWSVTFAFGLWGAKIANIIGINVAQWDFWQLSYPSTALENSVLADPTTVSNLGIILGALIAVNLAGKFSNKSNVNSKLFFAAVIGGFLMGYGARLAFGCNVGALFSGIASGSVHGWVWFLFAFIGSIYGVKARKYFYQ